MSNYERLTTKADEGNVFDNIVFCPNCPNKTEKYRCKNNSKNCFKAVINRLAKLEDKIENGTLIELPCKVGDKVYYVNEYRPTPRIEEYKVYTFTFDFKHGIVLMVENGYGFYKNQIFLTKAEAEAKLKELNGE